jgi:hypothetical protein
MVLREAFGCDDGVQSCISISGFGCNVNRYFLEWDNDMIFERKRGGCAFKRDIIP